MAASEQRGARLYITMRIRKGQSMKKGSVEGAWGHPAHIHSLGASTAKEKGFVSPALGRRIRGTLYAIESRGRHIVWRMKQDFEERICNYFIFQYKIVVEEYI